MLLNGLEVNKSLVSVNCPIIYIIDSMNNITFREFLPEEKEEVVHLMRGLNKEDKEELRLNKEKIKQLFRFAPDRKWVELFVAVYGQEIIGYAVFIKAFSVELLGLYGEIDELYIKPKYRNKGIGSFFIAWLEKHAKDNDCNAMYVVVTSQNMKAQQLYKRLGFEQLPLRYNYVKMLRKVR